MIKLLIAQVAQIKRYFVTHRNYSESTSNFTKTLLRDHNFLINFYQKIQRQGKKKKTLLLKALFDFDVGCVTCKSADQALKQGRMVKFNQIACAASFVQHVQLKLHKV